VTLLLPLPVFIFIVLVALFPSLHSRVSTNKSMPHTQSFQMVYDTTASGAETSEMYEDSSTAESLFYTLNALLEPGSGVLITPGQVY